MATVDYSPLTLTLNDGESGDLDLTVMNSPGGLLTYVQAEISFSGGSAVFDLYEEDERTLAKWLLARMSQQDRQSLIEEIEAEG
jgi:hypothetical protein